MTRSGRADAPSPFAGQVDVLFGNLSGQSSRKLLAVTATVAGAALAELAMLAAVLLFVGSLLDGGTSLEVLGIENLASPPAAAVLLIVGALAATALRLLVLRTGQAFATSVGHQIARRIFARLLRQPLVSYSTRDSSIVLSGMEKVQVLVTAILLPLVQAATGAAIAMALLVALISISPASALTAIGFLGSAFLLTSLILRRRLIGNSERVASMSRARIRAVQEALGSIRDILLDGSQHVFEHRFARFDKAFREAHASNLFLAAAPRYFVEAAGVIAIAVVAMVMSSAMGGLHQALPSLAAVTFIAYRLLPLVQQSYFGWSQLAGNRGALGDVLTLLSMPVEDEPASFARAVEPLTRDIVFDQVSFAYPGLAAILRNIDLRIEAGDRVGISGATGSGKSSLLDLLMGLVEPTSGEVRIDGRILDKPGRAAWRTQIAHVPQRIFLLDATILENIAFGRAAEEIDLERAWRAARIAQLEPTILSLPQQYRSMIGENGIRLSGGERQRLGIARALYRNASVLVLDEATNALDHETEARLLAAIAREHCGTLVIAAHRASSLSICDNVFIVEDGHLRRALAPLGASRKPSGKRTRSR
jgi:ATP-binding cassette subfamily B protein